MQCGVVVNTKPTGFVGRTKALVNKVVTMLSIGMTYVMCSMNAFAFQIDSNYEIKDLGDSFNPEGMILGLAFWIARLVGVSLLVWGIYGYVTARKDGEAESMNGAIGKLVSGVVLILMPNVLKGLNLI